MEVSIHITEQCNLNCKACLHMIPISNHKDYYWFVDSYIKPQLELLAKHSSIVDTLVIMGGEPTLHPDIASILYIARALFPDIPIKLATNGVFINKFENPEFIKSLIDNEINVCIVAYPYSSRAEEQYNKLFNILENNNVSFSLSSIIDQDQHFLIQPFRKEINNFELKPEYCKAHHYCTMLKDDKLWVCHLAAYVDSLKERFPELDWINVDEGAYVDLKDPDITDEMILEKMRSFSSICTHCVEPHRGWDSDDPTEYTNWARSEGKKEEWVRE